MKIKHTEREIKESALYKIRRIFLASKSFLNFGNPLTGYGDIFNAARDPPNVR